MTHVYRRPHDYAQHAAVVSWQPQPYWQIDATTFSLTLSAPAWTLGLSPSVDMTLATLTLTTPRWNVGNIEIEIVGDSLALATYRWTIAAQVAFDIVPATVTISTPAWTVNPDLVPYLIGYDLDDAVSLARTSGLVPSLSYAKTGNATVGVVTAQNPSASLPLADYTSIVLTVESGEYVWPSSIPTGAEWRLVTNTGMTISPLDATTRTLARGGDYWTVALTVNNRTGDEAAVLKAYLAQLRGRTHLTLLPDHAYLRRGELETNLYVLGADQTGRTLACYGGPPAQVDNAVRAGDMLSLEDRVYMITEDADTGAAGTVTLSIVPPLDGSPEDGALVNLLNPYGRFRLTDNVVRWSNAPGGFSSFNSLQFAEVRIPLYDVTFTEDVYIRAETNEILTDESDGSLLI